MTTTEAIKLALEALIGARAFLEGDAPVEIWGVNDKAITALREALAEQPAQQKPVAWVGEIAEEAELMLEKPRFRAVALYTTPPQRTCENCGEFGTCCLHAAQNKENT